MTIVVALAVDECTRLQQARKLVDGDSSEPYISLAVFDEVEESDIEEGCAALSAGLGKIRTTVSGIATFQGESPVLYAAVVLSEELRALHASVHDMFAEKRSRPNYHPGAWVPHITLRFCRDHGEAVVAFSQLLPCLLPGYYTNSALLRVSLPPVSTERRYELHGHI